MFHFRRFENQLFLSSFLDSTATFFKTEWVRSLQIEHGFFYRSVVGLFWMRS